jgi:hypothetical protein
VAEQLQLDVLKDSVLKGLRTSAILSVLKAKIGSDAVQKDLSNLSPATLVQVLHATLSGPVPLSKCCVRCTPQCTCASPQYSHILDASSVSYRLDCPCGSQRRLCTCGKFYTL